MDVVLHLDCAERRVEDLTAAAMPTVEAARVASVQAVDGIAQTALSERAEQVVVRGHDAELVQFREIISHEPTELVDERDVVAVVAEDSLLGRGARGDVEGAGVLRSFAVAHRTTMRCCAPRRQCPCREVTDSAR